MTFFESRNAKLGMSGVPERDLALRTVFTSPARCNSTARPFWDALLQMQMGSKLSPPLAALRIYRD